MFLSYSNVLSQTSVQLDAEHLQDTETGAKNTRFLSFFLSFPVLRVIDKKDSLLRPLCEAV